MADGHTTSTSTSRLQQEPKLSQQTHNHTTYLYPYKNPRALITYVFLTTHHYLKWSSELRNLLQAKQKTRFVDGKIPKPDTDPDLSRWLAANFMIVGWIRTSTDAKVQSTVTHFTFYYIIR